MTFPLAIAVLFSNTASHGKNGHSEGKGKLNLGENARKLQRYPQYCWEFHDRL